MSSVYLHFRFFCLVCKMSTHNQGNKFGKSKKAVAVDDFETMYQWHPQMILVSESPVTWLGFLNVSGTIKSGDAHWFKLKLKLPNYPSLRDVKLYFGEKITYLSTQEFKQRVAALTQSSLKVSIFLRQLQSLIGNLLQDGECIQDTTNDVIDDSVISMLQELKDAFDVPSEVKMLSDDNLHAIKFILNDVSLKLERTKDKDSPWRVVCSDLPTIQGVEPFETNVTSLIVARNKFEQQVERLAQTWESLQDIDQHCYIIDPPEPKPWHLYRRIFLSSSLFMLIKIDPLNPNDLPEIKFLGSEVEVEAKKDIVFSNIHKWDSNSSVLVNLLMLLNIYEFPQKELDSTSSHAKSTMDSDDKCCICFSLEIDGENFPDKICNNEKCKTHFHTSCLLQWLQAVPGNHFAFNQVHGSCPLCGESISCPID